MYFSGFAEIGGHRFSHVINSLGLLILTFLLSFSIHAS